MPQRPPLLVAAFTALALAGCGAASSTPSSSSSGPSPSSNTFTGTGFTTSIPQGWTDATSDTAAVSAVGASGTVAMLLIAPASVSNRVDDHIDVSVTAPEVPEDQLAGYLESATQNGAGNESAVQTFALDGATGLFVTYNLTAHGSSNKAQDMVVNHGDSTYEIVLNTSADDFSSQLPALQHVLNAWRWTPS